VSDFWQEGEHSGFYRPVVSLSYFLEFRLWGLTPLGYHVTNLLLHLAATLLVGVTAYQLVGRSAAAGIAALAFGTETIPRVGRVVGPGSPAVAAAQIQVQRYGCSCVMLFGPSESIIIADEHQDPKLVAADVLNEAEHGPDSASLLVTPSEALVERVSGFIDEALEELPQPRRDYAASAISKYGGAMLVRDLEEAVAFANEYAPEHLLVSTANPEEQLAGLRNAGEILLGETPIVAANLSIGVPATLPTGGFARFSSGVTARTFTKTSSVARTSPEALERLAPSILAIADHEGFPAHARSIHLRRERRG
jgi:histidinol dehydrogenase